MSRAADIAAELVRLLDRGADDVVLLVVTVGSGANGAGITQDDIDRALRARLKWR